MFEHLYLSVILLLLLFMIPEKVNAHLSDEVAIRTKIAFEDQHIELVLRIEAGMLFGQHYLKILDPDKNQKFETDDIINFSEYLCKGIEVKLDERGSYSQPGKEPFF